MRTPRVRRPPSRPASALHRPADPRFTSLLVLALGGAPCAGVAQSAEPAGQAAAAPAARAPLDILEYEVQGNRVLAVQAIEDALGPWLGPGRSAEDVDHARAALEAAYHDRGYKTVAVTIPRQVPSEGVIRLEVQENPVGRLTVSGSKYHSLAQIKAEAPSLAEGSVPRFDALQADLLALNQQPDRRITPALKAGIAPGTVDVDLVVDDNLPLHGSLELNNRRSQGTHEVRTTGTLSYDNLWQAGHSLTLSAQTAPQRPSDAKVFFASYLARFGRDPFSLLGNFIKSDSRVSSVGGTAVIGRGTIVGLRGVVNLPVADPPADGGSGSSDSFLHSLSAGLDYKNLNTVTTLASGGIETPVRYAPITLGYSATLRGDGMQWQGGLSFAIAAPHVGSSASALDDNRFRARGQQAVWRGNLSHQRDWPGGFQTLLRLNAQWTDQPLITSEQFSIGGEDSVRGYLESEALGDLGASGSIELRAPAFGRGLTVADQRVIDELRAYLSLDGARAQLRDALPEQQGRFDLASVGVGLRFGLLSVLDGSLHWARVFNTGPNTPAGSRRVLFRLTGSF